MKSFKDHIKSQATDLRVLQTSFEQAFKRTVAGRILFRCVCKIDYDKIPEVYWGFVDSKATYNELKIFAESMWGADMTKFKYQCSFSDAKRDLFTPWVQPDEAFMQEMIQWAEELDQLKTLTSSLLAATIQLYHNHDDPPDPFVRAKLMASIYDLLDAD